MSSGMRYSAGEARAAAETLVKELAGLCYEIEIAGSLRREKADVGDVEIVAKPHHAPELLARLDKMVMDGRIYKARYPNNQERWGERYRGLIYKGIRHEIFLADADNWGYILWLRTGPGDANTWVMSRVKHHNLPHHAAGGYWWRDERKLHVPDERVMFGLLGMPWLEPRARTMVTYAKLFGANDFAAPHWAAVDDVPTQVSMF